MRSNMYQNAQFFLEVSVIVELKNATYHFDVRESSMLQVASRDTAADASSADHQDLFLFVAAFEESIHQIHVLFECGAVHFDRRFEPSHFTKDMKTN